MIDKTNFLYKKTAVPAFLFQPIDMLDDQKVEYLWTRDRQEIKQYMQMIDQNYGSELDVENAFKNIGASDLRSNFFVARNSKGLIMGVRVTLNDPFLKYSVPTEKSNFSFNDLFPEYDLVNNRYAEVSKFTVLDEYRNDINHYVNGFKFFKDLLDKNNAKYLIICGSRARHRIYKKFASNYFKYVDMRKLDISLWPEYATISFAQDSWAVLYENPDVT